jgi:hypothetical protein
MSYPYVFTLGVICLALIGVIGTLFSNEVTRDILRKRFVWILGSIAIAGLLKYPFDGQIFSGQEYEDAYIYNAAARFFLSNAALLPTQSFLTTSCSVGSLAACNEYSTYSGHVIGYSATIAGAGKLFGYQPELANFVSFYASILCAGLLFIAALLIGNSITYAIAAVLIFVLLPFQNLFATASVVEPFSSLFVTLSLLSYLQCVHNRSSKLLQWEIVLSWSTLFLVWLACILIKRENALSIAILPSITVMLILFERRSAENWGWLTKPVLMFWILLALFFLLVIDVAETIRAEVPDVGGFPFSPLFLSKLLPFFLSTLFDFKLFLGLSVFVPIAVYAAIKRTSATKLIWYPIILFGMYLLIYSLHYRSYYFIRTGDVTEFDTYRYLSNLMPLYTLLLAGGIQYCLVLFGFVHTQSHRARQVALVLFVGFAIIISWMQSSQLKTYFTKIEKNNRLDIVNAVLELTKNVNQPYAILTDDVLLYQIWGDGTEFMIDLRSIDSDRGLATLTKILNERTVYFVKKPYQDETIERNRYLKIFQHLETLEAEKRLQDPEGRFAVYILPAK